MKTKGKTTEIMVNNKHKIESKRALSVVLVIINALVILPIIGHLGIGIYNAMALTVLSIGVFLYDSRNGNLNNSFLSSLIFMATALTLDNTYYSTYMLLPLYLQIAGVILILALFFFIPSIVRFALAHFKNHPIMLLVCGRIIATVAGVSAVAFIYLKSGFTLHFGDMEISITQGWSFWSAFVIMWIFILLYQLGRNRRDMTTNHRFLYNTVALYLLSMIIYIGYIRDAIHFA